MTASRAFLAWRMVLEAESADDNNIQRKYNVDMRARRNPVHYYSDKKFIKLYRLSKRAFLDLCDLLEHTSLKSTQRVSIEEKVLCALLFYSKGEYQCAVGEANNFSQQTISVFVEQVTNALIHPSILGRFLKFPKTIEERTAVRQRFNTLHGIPGVLGCVDGSHFKIFKPAMDVEHLYFCRKHYHSINVQMVCDADCKILSVNPKFGGATHDAFIWENSELNNFMQSLHRNNEKTWLLGDSGYPQRPWLMTPYKESEAPLTPIQEAYNKMQSKSRVTIENTFGRLKNRWRCCIKYRAMHYKPEKCANIITACCVLHNVALMYNVPDPDDDNEGFTQDEEFLRHDVVEEYQNDTDLMIGRAMRDQLTRRLASRQ